MENNFVNIILIHRGQSNYLDTALKCARESNPGANIFLIGDRESCDLDFVKCFNIKDYSLGASEFAKNYEHFSTNTYDFELFCIQRWFILRDFMEANNLNNCFYIDSDVLIFSDLISERSKFSNFLFTLSEETCGHNSFWNSFKAIDDFCVFVENIYNKSDEDSYNELINFWEKYQISKELGGVCDMTLFNMYKKRRPGLIGETASLIENSTYDHNFSSSSQNGVIFKNILGIKNIIWQNRIPYVKNSSGDLIKFNTFHFQGATKKYMARAFNRKKIYPYRLVLRNIFYLFLNIFNVNKFYIKLRNYITNL